MKFLLDFLFPPKCIICKKYFENYLCENCKDTILKNRISIYMEKSYSVSFYEGNLKKAIFHFKYKKKKELAEPLSNLMIKFIQDNIPIHEIDKIVFVPLHPEREKERGFNQAKLLAEKIAEHFQINLCDTLQRIKNTKSQTKLSKTKRKENVRNAFKIGDKSVVKGNVLLLIDDIITTGATVSECAKVLKKAGASEIYSLTLARSK